MSEIVTFPFNKEDFTKIKSYHFGLNWPVVYLIEDSKEIYIGETTRLYGRSKEHYENPERRKLKNIHIITDDEYNKSAALDIESSLIRYISAEGSFMLQNGNEGLQNHNYYDREKYKTKFEIIWKKLQKMSLVKKDLVQIRNSDLFKYSPYKSLTEDQLFVASQIYKDIQKNETNTFIVKGKPGTGKTILATYLFKFLKEKDDTKNMKIGLVVPMSSLRKTIGKVFSKIKGLKSGMVIGPNDVVKQQYDLLIVDESHRLQRRKGIMGFGAFDNVNKRLGLGNEGTQLDWIIKSSKHQIFFYDENQSVKPADIRPEDFKKLNSKKYEIHTQMRIEAGEEYIKFIEDIFDLKIPNKTTFPNYDLKIFDDIEEMVDAIKTKEKKYKLSRVVAGFAWPWHTNPGKSNWKQDYDIEINGSKLIWNSTAQDWVNSPNAINEVGCIHTVQGYDLNYVGVIIGPEFSYDNVSHKFIVNKEKYFDINGRNGITNPEELERYIINIYKTLLTRGINGTYIYICDENLRNYFFEIINKNKISTKLISSPYVGEMVSLPLFESVGCGELMYADSNVQEMISVRKDYISVGQKYFVLKTSGDSMNKAGINDGDLVLCRKDYTPAEGSRVIALIGDDATLKEYHREGDYIILKPCSTNPIHKPLKLNGDDEEIKIQGVVIRVLKEEE